MEVMERDMVRLIIRCKSQNKVTYDEVLFYSNSDECSEGKQPHRKYFL